jgi:hypothetical protein
VTLIVWVLIVHWTLAGTDHPIEVYQTEADCVGLGIYRLEHTSRVSPKGGETFRCVKTSMTEEEVTFHDF